MKLIKKKVKNKEQTKFDNIAIIIFFGIIFWTKM